MEDKMFELLEKVYVELQQVKSDVKEVKSEVNEVKKQVTKIEAIIENDIKPDIKLALQGFIDTNESLTVIKEEVSRHEEIILRKVR